MTLLSQLDTAVQLAAAGEWSAIGSRMATQIPVLIDYSSSLVERVDRQVLQQRTKAIEESQQARQRLVIIVPIAALLTLFAATALGWYVTRTITGPLFELIVGAEALARKDFQKQIDVRGHDELALLGKAFNDASLQLRHLYQLEADLAHINRVSMMGELAASLAHEIKQPIGAAVTNAEVCLRLLNRNQPDVPDAREAALEMTKDARRAADIIERVRSLYRKGSSQLEMIDVNDVIKEMVVMLRNEASRYSVAMHTDLSSGIPKVMADRVQLQQVLMNLMLNGIEAMSDHGGELSIKSRLSEDGQLLISVTDNGVGLPAEKADQIFNAFFTTKPQGTGLGLVITRSILESHGGRVWATANSGQGTTFHFTLPISTAVSA
jgi:signal transduction histidine kinase